ncbi:SPOR domain-containing protein [Aminiphilus circumscriptus]|uniref:SPOR domain-containing protein n=1 Tax=Aminiphilus circumscriptus TaxID=290732 RepID=UPI000A061FD4|nr:SPOR domain-containing protein [Aminiphilus circumscriptus]
MNARRSRRYKMRRPMFAFGQLMLPIVGIIAVGLLVIGVKLFFLPTSKGGSLYQSEVSRSVTVTPTHSLQPEDSGNSSTSNTVSVQNGDGPVAVPVGEPQTTGVPPSTKTNGQKQAVEKTAVPAKPVPGSEKALATTISSPTSGNWTVQIGAFTEKGQAEQLASKARKEGYTVLVTQGDVKGVLYYRVRIVAGKSRGEALELEKKLKASGYPTYVVPQN